MSLDKRVGIRMNCLCSHTGVLPKLRSLHRQKNWKFLFKINIEVKKDYEKENTTSRELIFAKKIMSGINGFRRN